jgi:LPXTG-motif cell wall-anchored protein
MQKLRVAAAATAVALLGAFASVGQANAATSTKGIGTTSTSSSLVDVALGTAGDLLHIRVLGDDSKATVDPAVDKVSSALTEMFGLKITSKTIPALNLTLPTNPLKAQTPGGQSSVNGAALNLGAVPALLSGALNPSALAATVDGDGAHSSLSSSLVNMNLVSGLLNVSSVSTSLGSLAGTGEANGGKGIDVGAVSVLNLGALLKGLGIDITKLPIGNVSGLLDSLHIENLVSGLPAGTALEDLFSTLQTQLTSLGSLTGSDALSGVPILGTLNSTLGGLPLGGGLLSGGSLVGTKTVTDLISSINGLLTQVLGSALDVLDGIDLLKLNGLHIGSVVKSASTKEASKADVVGTLGSVAVGGITLPGLDLSSTLATVTGLVNTVESTLSGVLGSLSPDLANLLNVDFFAKKSDNGITSSGGYIRSLAGITGLGVGINPPAILGSIITSLNSTAGIGGLLSTAGGAGALTSVVSGLTGTALGGTLNSLLGGVASLAGGASIKIADVSTGSNFAVPAAAVTPVSQLPRTGANTTVFLIIGMLMVGGVIVGRRFMPVRVKTDQ